MLCRPIGNSAQHSVHTFATLRQVGFVAILSIFLASSFFYISSLVHDRQAAEDNKEQFFGIIRLA